MRQVLVVTAILLGTFTTAQANSPSASELGLQREFRFYRIQIYNAFHRVRPEYDRRLAAGEAAFSAWKSAGGQAHQAEALVQWYRGAKAASLPGALAVLPPLPEFPEAIVVAQPVESKKLNSAAQGRHDSHPDANTIYRVREVATRSVSHPENVPGDRRQPHAEVAASKKSPSVWSAFSRVFLKSISTGEKPGSQDK